LKFDAPATVHVIPQLSPHVTYRLRIRTSSFVGQSAFTDFIEASVLPPGNISLLHSARFIIVN